MNHLLVRRCAMQFRRTQPSTRRFNSSANPQGQGTANGNSNRANPRDDYEWVRHANEFAKTFSEFSTNAYVHSERQWAYKGPLWGFTIGALVGYWNRPSNATAEDENRRLKSLARDLHEETRELKTQLTAVQNSVDGLQGASTHSPTFVHLQECASHDEKLKRYGENYEKEMRRLRRRMDEADGVSEKFDVVVDMVTQFGQFVALTMENGDPSKMTKEDRAQMHDIADSIREKTRSLAGLKCNDE
ncbi:Aste57867_7980 [Aphanomyces stellatus]|uniref:Aste57867_7980 protein n=1 Tax=Aphanomyces stellatus TaxID=120398 RepID=A0A485KJ41_9STRA|nr:hypothetical protein As57867_007950 [Aphanomyces stellatus]VFT84873.1 Aste57867_7980 [Aphanomyces stellatus]